MAMINLTRTGPRIRYLGVAMFSITHSRTWRQSKCSQRIQHLR